MFPETTEIGYLIESIRTPKSISITSTPKTNSLTFQPREISHVMSGIICCLHSTSAISVMSKRTQEDAGEERVTANSKPMRNLVSRYSVSDPNLLASTASESPGKTKSESQLPLSSLNEQQPRTGRPVMGASSSDYSEWNIDDKWSSQEWKSGDMLGARRGRPVGGQEPTQDIDKFVIDDDDMDSDTATHSIPWSSACMHELSVSSDFLDLFIIFTFLLSVIIILKQFLLPFNFPEVKW